MKLILHIGTEKTATTTLQHYFYNNRKVYEERNTHVITSLGIGNNRSLVSCVMRGERLDDYHQNLNIQTVSEKQKHNREVMDNFKSELAGLKKNIKQVVITSEHFHSRLIYDSEVSELKNILDEFFSEIKVIAYLRPQVEVVHSLYSTILKSGGTIEFDKFISENPLNMPEYYDYESLLNRWCSSFGKDNINVRLFVKNQLHGGDIIKDFCSASCIPFIDAEHMSFNESIETWAQEIIRQCNVVNTPEKRKLKEYILSSSLAKGKGQRLSCEQASKFQSQFEAANNSVAKAWFGRDTLFKIDFSKYGEGMFLDQGIKSAMNSLMGRGKVKLSSVDIDTLRDISLSLESTDLFKAHDLMQIASKCRPDGPHISKKLKAYEQRIKNKLSLEGDSSFVLSEKERISYYLSGGIEKFSHDIKTPIDYTVDKLFRFNKNIYIENDAYYLQDLRAIWEVIPDHLSIPVQCGDALRKCRETVFIKARKLSDTRSILLKLNSKRHWNDYLNIHEHDTSWENKKDDVVWRGANTGFGSGQDRLDFLKKYFSQYNVGFSHIINTMKVKRQDKVKYDETCANYLFKPLSYSQQLKNKYILSIEGNDVSTGLKWIMNSNSVPIMRAPKVETWMMEGLLKPYIHYLPLNENMDNLAEILLWARENDGECKKIARNGQVFMSQFTDYQKEISLQRMIVMSYLCL